MRGHEPELEPPLDRLGRPRLRLRLLGLTDLHANLYPYDYYRDCPDDSVGLARVASLVAEARGEAPNCLLFDNGDILQGTLLGDLAAEAMMADPTAIHPIIAAMNTLDYAVATLGNHDFNYGLGTLKRAYGQARFPVICCNMRKSDGSPWFPASVVIERAFVDESATARRLKVGVIGVAPSQIAQWDETHLRGRLTTVDIVEAVRAELGELRARVDLLVVLGHSGISRLASTRGEENAGQDLAKLDGVDALFLGHQHRLLPGEDLLVCLVSTQKPARSAASLLSWRVFGAAISESSTFGSKWTLAGKSSRRGSRSDRSRDATQAAARSRWSNRTRPCSKRPRPRTKPRFATSARPLAGLRERCAMISR
jgi:2',3'-cyclic-nucleotide 2'-phosphodiesterase (5'-nucleotidase family)